MEISKQVEEYQESYDGVTAEDKLLERGFKRDFSDVPLSMVDHLYKLFKRRPRYIKRWIMSYIVILKWICFWQCVFVF